MTHGGRQGRDSQPAQHVSLVADGPERHHVHAALSRTRQDGHVAQRDGRDLLPGARGAQFALPVTKGEKTQCWQVLFDALILTLNMPTNSVMFILI